MENEMRPIDANAMLAYLEKQYKLAMDDPDPAACYILVAVRCFKKYIKNMPTVDAVEVKRCEHCEHGSHVDTPEGRVWCERICRYMLFEGYCSYGERKDNE